MQDIQLDTQVEITISRDFSTARFTVIADIETGEGMPSATALHQIWERLPGKDASESITTKPAGVKRYGNPDPPATARQRECCIRNGVWCDGMSKTEASEALRKLGL